MKQKKKIPSVELYPTCAIACNRRHLSGTGGDPPLLYCYREEVAMDNDSRTAHGDTVKRDWAHIMTRAEVIVSFLDCFVGQCNKRHQVDNLVVKCCAGAPLF